MKSKYFVLKPAGTTLYAKASRIAMHRYAHEIEIEDPKFAEEIRTWAEAESTAAMKNMRIGLETGELTFILAKGRGNKHG